MSEQKISETSLIFMTDSLRDIGNEMLWRTIDNTDVAENIHKTITAHIEKSMIAFYVIESGHKTISRISVFNRRDKAKMVDLTFAYSPIAYV